QISSGARAEGRTPPPTQQSPRNAANEPDQPDPIKPAIEKPPAKADILPAPRKNADPIKPDNGDKNNKDDGDQNNKDDGDQNNKADGQKTDKDNGDKNNKNDGDKNNKDDGEQGVVKSVDGAKGVIVVTCKRKGETKDVSYLVAKDAKVMIAGKPAKLA